MDLALACAWRPRGEMGRLRRLLPVLRAPYCGMAVSLPPDTHAEQIAQLRQLIGDSVVVTTDWSHGRHAAVEKALEHACTHVQYADMDRLLHWVETFPEEWRRTISRIPQADCLIISRTEEAYSTHPRALRETERISNAVCSHFLGRYADVSAGSKGFSRPAAEFLMAHSRPGRALGMDAEWPLLLLRAGFTLDWVSVDGLEWESADRYLDQAAGRERQTQLAATYDQDPAHWARRVEIALEIVETALEVMQRPLPNDPRENS
jgi:hypothetical protein